MAQATNIRFSRITSSTVRIFWDPGSGVGRTVFINNVTALAAEIPDYNVYSDGPDWLIPIANAEYGLGDRVADDGTGNFWLCVYRGAGSYVDVTGLEPGTWKVHVAEYDGDDAINATTAADNPAEIILPASAQAALVNIEEGVSDAASGLTALTLPRVAAPLIVSVLDIAPLRTRDARRPGVYIAVTREDQARPWMGAMIKVTKDPEKVEQATSLIIPTESDLGYTLTQLGSGPVGYWDLLSTIDVQMIAGQLENHDEIDVLNGANWALVGDEIIAYQNAELIAENQYRLSTLLRGLRDTDDQLELHSTNDRFIPLRFDNLQFLELDTAEIGTTPYFKVVPGGADPSLSERLSTTIVGRSITPFSPSELMALMNDDGDLEISWTRRTRDVVRLFATTPVPLLEEVENYEVDISNDLESLRGGEARPPIAVSEDSAIYTADMQSEDGVDASVDTLHITVYQKSESVGRGKGRTITING